MITFPLELVGLLALGVLVAGLAVIVLCGFFARR